MIQKIMFLTDIHVPFNIPLGPIWQFMEDFKPTTIIIGGDAHDWTAVSEWVTDQSRHLDGGIIAQNYDQLSRVVLDPIRRIAPAASVVFLTGNHEDWIRKAVDRNPNGRGFWELERNLPSWVKIVPLNQAYHASSHLCYLHGLYTTKFHAFQTVHAVHKSVLYGHTHDVQRYTDISPVDVHTFFTGASCGCLCTLNPSYMKGKPNKWVNGFNFAYLDTRTEEFSEQQIYIIRNRFWAEGRRYR